METTSPSCTLTGEAAYEMAGAAMAAATAMGKRVFVAVVSPSGQLLAFAGHHDTPRICHTLAQDKAYTAMATGMDTTVWKSYVNSCPEEEQRLMHSQPRFVAAEGGLPVVCGDLVAGGIGVSGAGQNEDGLCAAAGIARFESLSAGETAND